MAGRSVVFHVEGAPDSASVAACVGICRYGTGSDVGSVETPSLPLDWTATALLEPLIFEKIDMASVQ